MANESTLDGIALGEATPAQAREAIGAAFREGSPQAAQRVYTVLRAWVWKALNGRRRDPELREWFDILKRTGAYLSSDHKSQAERLQVLNELIYESISASEIQTPSEALKRQHVKHILIMLFNAQNKQIERSEIGTQLRLGQANLTRVLNLMASSGLVERVKFGKQAIFQLTTLGVHEAQKIKDYQSVAHRQPQQRRGAVALDVVGPSDAGQGSDRRGQFIFETRKRWVASNPTSAGNRIGSRASEGIKTSETIVLGNYAPAGAKRESPYAALRMTRREVERSSVPALVEKLEAVPNYTPNYKEAAIPNYNAMEFVSAP